MQSYEYKVVAAPRQAKRMKGARTVADRYARTLSELMNAEAATGWEYLRADTLPVEQRKGFMGATGESFHTVLIFRRAKGRPAEQHEPTIAEVRPLRAEDPELRRPLGLGPARRDD